MSFDSFKIPNASLEKAKEELLGIANICAANLNNKIEKSLSLISQNEGGGLIYPNIMHCSALRADIDGLPNIYLYGTVGTGKTHLAASLARSLMIDSLIPLYFTTGVELLFKIKSTFSPNNSCDTGELITRYSECPVLIVDDIGIERSTEWVIETFYMIIDSRYTGMRPTIITSNFHPKDLAQKLNDRLVSRLFENALVLKLDGEDFRIKKHKPQNPYMNVVDAQHSEPPH